MSGYTVKTRATNGNKADWFVPIPPVAIDTVALVGNSLIAQAMAKMGVVIQGLRNEPDFEARLMASAREIEKAIQDA